MSADLCHSNDNERAFIYNLTKVFYATDFNPTNDSASRNKKKEKSVEIWKGYPDEQPGVKFKLCNKDWDSIGRTIPISINKCYDGEYKNIRTSLQDKIFHCFRLINLNSGVYKKFHHFFFWIQQSSIFRRLTWAVALIIRRLTFWTTISN